MGWALWRRTAWSLQLQMKPFSQWLSLKYITLPSHLCKITHSTVCFTVQWLKSHSKVTIFQGEQIFHRTIKENKKVERMTEKKRTWCFFSMVVTQEEKIGNSDVEDKEYMHKHATACSVSFLLSEVSGFMSAVTPHMTQRSIAVTPLVFKSIQQTLPSCVCGRCTTMRLAVRD